MCKKFWKAFGSEKQLIRSIIHQQFLIHVSYNNAIILMESDTTCQFPGESLSVCILFHTCSLGDSLREDKSLASGFRVRWSGRVAKNPAAWAQVSAASFISSVVTFANLSELQCALI